MDERLIELRVERRKISQALKASIARSRRIAANWFDPRQKPVVTHCLLLRMVEGLIAAHVAAKVDDDGYTLDLIEDALRHVGKRLAAETTHGRSFGNRKSGASG